MLRLHILDLSSGLRVGHLLLALDCLARGIAATLGPPLLSRLGSRPGLLGLGRHRLLRLLGRRLGTLGQLLTRLRLLGGSLLGALLLLCLFSGLSALLPKLFGLISSHRVSLAPRGQAKIILRLCLVMERDGGD